MNYKLIKSEKIINIAGLYSFYYFEHDNNFYFSGEQHDFWEIMYADMGEMSVVSENNGFLLQQGEIIFHKPNAFHSLASTKKEPHNVLIVSFETNSTAMQFFNNKVFALNNKQQKILSLFMEEIKATFSDNFKENCNVITNSIVDPSAFQLGISHLEHLLIQLLRENSISKRNKSEHDIARKNVENALIDSIKMFLQENLHQQISLQNICSHYNMSQTYLCEAFRKEVGQSIIDYYIGLKTKEAKYLIRKGEMNFTQISEKLGYTSIHHFSRSFKNKTGMSPSSYKKTLK